MSSPSFVTACVAAGSFLATLLVAVTSINSYRKSHDTDPSKIKGSRLLGSTIRAWYFDCLKPFEDYCVQKKFQPSTLTYTQLGGSFIVALCFSFGAFVTGGWFLLASGSLDIIDGRLARRTGSASKQGAFLDSVVDRYADALAYFGLSAYFANTWLFWVVLAGLMGTIMVSYTRARGQSLGIDCDIGFLQRPERYVVLGFGMIFGGLLDAVLPSRLGGGSQVIIVATLLFIAAVANTTALQRARFIASSLRESEDAR